MIYEAETLRGGENDIEILQVNFRWWTENQGRFERFKFFKYQNPKYLGS